MFPSSLATVWRAAPFSLLIAASCAPPGDGSAPPPNLTSAPQLADVAARQQEADAQRAREEVERRGSSCEDIAALEEAGRGEENLSARDVYAAAASRRRYERSRDIELAITKVVKEAQSVTEAATNADPMSPSSAATQDVTALQTHLSHAADLAGTLTCYDRTAAKEAEQSVNAAASALDQAVTCRASPACRAARLVGPICAAIASRDRATADDLKKDYATLAHTPFDAAACPKPSGELAGRAL